MAIVTAAVYQSWANQTYSGSDLTSLTTICAQVDAAIKTRLYRTIESASYTLILPTPTSLTFSLSRYAPIQVSGFSLYVNSNAGGDPAAFTSDDLLTMYTDYVLDVGPDDTTQSFSGIVTNIKYGWQVQFVRPLYAMALAPMGMPGTMKVTFTGGYSSVPNDLVEAACLAVSKILNMRKMGTGVQSESWNGDSYSLNSQAFTYGILGDPVIAGILMNYENKAAFIG